MYRPSLTVRVVRGLDTVVELAAADIESDPKRWPKSHDVHTAIHYLRRLTAWWKTLHEE